MPSDIDDLRDELHQFRGDFAHFQLTTANGFQLVNNRIDGLQTHLNERLDAIMGVLNTLVDALAAHMSDGHGGQRSA
jgi:hypothetical protein